MNIIELTEQLQDFVRKHEGEVAQAVHKARRDLVSEKARILSKRRELAQASDSDINSPSVTLQADFGVEESVRESKLFLVTRMADLIAQISDQSFEIQTDAIDLGVEE